MKHDLKKSSETTPAFYLDKPTSSDFRRRVHIPAGIIPHSSHKHRNDCIRCKSADCRIGRNSSHHIEAGKDTPKVSSSPGECVIEILWAFPESSCLTYAPSHSAAAYQGVDKSFRP